MVATSTVNYEIDGPLGVVSLADEPHNMLSPDLLDTLLGTLDKARADGCRAILLRSSQTHFSSGDDVSLFDLDGPQPDPVDRLAVLSRLETFPLPVVASVHGACIGGGLDLILCADYVLVARSARLGCAEAALGLNSLLGAVQRLALRIGPHRAKEMVMLGRRYEPETLERWGLVNLVVDDDLLDDVSRAVALELANGPTVAHTSTKELARIALAEGVSAADARMAGLQQPVWESRDLREGLRSFTEHGPGLARFAGN